jgi:hypothetical protein
MLVATFGPSTAWQGREIIWDVDHFILVGHGAISAAGVLDYDRRGQLLWADPALRPWVTEIDRWENSGRQSPLAGAVGAAGPPPPAGRRFPVWVIVVIAVAAVALVLAIAAVSVLPGLVRTELEGFAGDAEVRANVMSIQVGIEAYAAGHDGRFPAPGEVSPLGMVPYVTPWPVNPYTDQPMVDGGGAGNFRYDVSADGGAYKLIGYGGDGRQIIELGGGTPSTV